VGQPADASTEACDACACWLVGAPIDYARQNSGRISMIKTLHHDLSVALSRAARSLDTQRRRFLTFGAGAVSAAIAVPVLATPALVVVRSPVATRQMLGYRETEHVRRYYATTRL